MTLFLNNSLKDNYSMIKDNLVALIFIIFRLKEGNSQDCNKPGIIQCYQNVVNP